MTIPPSKSKPQRWGENIRRFEWRDCPKYDECLNDAAHKNLACVPGKGCKENKKIKEP